MASVAAGTKAAAWAKAGAITYVLWGLWHIPVAYRTYLSAETIDEPAVQARIVQGALHILFFACFAIVVGYWNWWNSRIAFWAQLLVIGWTEVVLLLVFIVPGLFPWLPTGWVGPALWGAAVALTTYAYRSARGVLA